MRKILLLVLILLIHIGCKLNRYEKPFIGAWYVSSEYHKLEFTVDSLIIYDGYNNLATWKANKSEITISEKPFLKDSIEERKINYRFIHDDLLIVFKPNDTIKKDSLIRAKSFLEFIFKKYNSKISLKKNPNSKYLESEFHTSIKIFMYAENNKIITKTEYSNSLGDLDNNVSKHLKKINDRYERYLSDFKIMYEYKKKSLTIELEEKIRQKWINKNVSFYLFSDMNIPQELIDDCIRNLKKSRIKNVYQIYSKTENSAESDFYNMKGIKK
jgi:hypothetical protein